MTTYRATLQTCLIILAAGGTGGHIFPALSLAEELQSYGYIPVLITDRRCVLPSDTQEKFSLVCIVTSGGLVGKRMLRILQGVIYLILGIIESLILIRRLKPSVVVGFGGYPSVPPIIAALLMGYPTVIHEQNAVLGKANRLLAPFVTKLALTFIIEQYRNAVYTGTPVRLSIQKTRVIPYIGPLQQGRVRILIIGGSQGAQVFDTVVPHALAQLPKILRTRIRVSQQVRIRNQVSTAILYTKHGVIGELENFFEDMPAHLSEAHLVIARSGASTVAELTVSGRPAILIPYPYAIASHQAINAQAMANSGGAWLIPQDIFTPEFLALKLQTLCMEPARLIQAAACSRIIASPDSVKLLANVVTSLVF